MQGLISDRSLENSTQGLETAQLVPAPDVLVKITLSRKGEPTLAACELSTASGFLGEVNYLIAANLVPFAQVRVKIAPSVKGELTLGTYKGVLRGGGRNAYPGLCATPL